MEDVLEVECTHIEDELMRVRFANSQLVSDHPSEWGGNDTGPAPGEIILMALTSASALAGRQFATENGLDVAHIAARSSMTTLKEGLADEQSRNSLPHLTYVERFWRLLEVDGRLSDAERDALVEAMAENRVAKTIRNGMRLKEEVIFSRSEDGRGREAKLKGGNPLLKNREPMPPGEARIVSTAENWRVTASALDDRTCLVKAAGSMSVVGDRISSQRCATPEELLLGGLAACTTIYIARNAIFHEIPVESVHVRVRAQIPADPTEPIIDVEKIAEVAGEFTDKEIAKLKDFAGLCAFGVTLRRSTPIVDNVLVSDVEQTRAASPGVEAIDRPVPMPSDPAFCDDGSCCVPTAAQ